MENKAVPAKKKAPPRRPAAKAKPAPATDLKALLAIPAQIDACTQKVLDKLTGFSPAVEHSSVFTGAGAPSESAYRQNALRYEAIQSIICGGRGQGFVEEIAVEGVQPTPAALQRYLDRVIATSTGRAA